MEDGVRGRTVRRDGTKPAHGAPGSDRPAPLRLHPGARSAARISVKERGRQLRRLPLLRFLGLRLIAWAAEERSQFRMCAELGNDPDEPHRLGAARTYGRRLILHGEGSKARLARFYIDLDQHSQGRSP